MTSIWAHRGTSGRAPENTLTAFELAAALGADGVELDLQRTSDGHLVVIHDETVDRTTNGTGRVVDLTLAELRSLDASASDPEYAGARVPTLREVFDLVAGTGMVVNIELKNSIEPYPGMEEQVAALVAEAGFADRVTYSSFNHYSLRTLLAMRVPSPVGMLYSDPIVDPWVYATYLGVQAIHPHWTMLAAPGVVDACHERGLAVNTWTVPPARAADVALLGVDAIITNEPDAARAAM